MAANDRGNSGAARQLLLPLAQQGDAASQFQLSLLYANGKGGAVNVEESLRWLRSAATKGYGAAQSNLGAAYSRGQGVPQDYVRAVAWFSLAVANGSKEAATNREVALRRMTVQQKVQAQELSAKCLSGNLQACD
jgi:TPR repeat protein